MTSPEMTPDEMRERIGLPLQENLKPYEPPIIQITPEPEPDADPD